MKTLIIADHNHQHLNPAVWSVLTAAKALTHDIDMMVMGHECIEVARQAAQIAAINRVLCVDAPHYADALVEEQAALLEDYLAKKSEYTHIVFAATAAGKNLAPRLAALLGLSLVSEVVEIVSPEIFVRPMYAGNVLVTVQVEAPMKIMTVRYTAFSASAFLAKVPAMDESSKIVFMPPLPPLKRSCVIKKMINTSKRPELSQARVVIAGGRGLGSAEHFGLIEKMADKLNAAVGASRAAVDSGYVSNDCQIGQTGKIIAPDLYIAVGISGAIQHLAGIKDAKIIVAINKDEDAPIMQVADYAIIGDFAQVLPELEAVL